MAIVITDKMYVGFDMRQEEKDEPQVKLGFATYIEDNAAYEKRQSTIDSWSDGGHYSKKKNPKSEILDNTLLDGFKIARSVRRHGWGSGNVLWRIEDPRGFELEISSANMASVMDCTTIVKGEIQGKCKWGWNTVGGSKVVLLPENSQPYRDALNDTARRNTKSLAIKDLTPGDSVELKSGRKAKFLGSYHYVSSTNPDYDDCQKAWVVSDKKTFFFQDKDELFTVSRPQVISVTYGKAMTLEQAAKHVNDALLRNARLGALGNGSDNIVFVSPKSIDTESFKLVLVETTKEVAFKRTDYGSGKTWKRPPVFSRTSRGLLRVIDPQSSFQPNEFRAYLVDEAKLADHILNPIATSQSYDWRRGEHVSRINASYIGSASITNFWQLMVSYEGKLYNPRTY